MDSLLDRAPCGFLSVHDDGTIVAINSTLLDLLGYSRAELEGWHIQSLLAPGGKVFYQTHFFPLLKMQGSVEEIYLSLRTRGGDELPVLVNAAQRERGGRTVSDWILIRIHQRSRYEDEILRAKRAAEEANQARSKFLSMMSHDLRTPLQAISGYADLLAAGVEGPVNEEQIEDLGRIRSAARHLLRLMTDILDFAQLEKGRVDVRIETVAVDEAFTRAEDLLALRMREAGLTFIREECGAGLSVRADPDRLQQILLNLLSNAVKFTASGGTITLSCASGDEEVLIRVRDTGRGIPSEQLERIFEPFVQVDPGRQTATNRGVGLGLSISQELARAMGGDLTAESTPGQGSVFTLRLLPAV